MKKVISVIAVLLIIALSVVPAFAADTAEDVQSPTGTFLYHVYVIPTEGGTGDWYFTSEIDENAEQGVHIYPIAYEGYTFDHWELRGEYRHEEQQFPVKKLSKVSAYNLLSKIDANGFDDQAYGAMDVVIHSDLYCYPYYVKKDTTVPATATVKPDGDKTSPKTGTGDHTGVYAVIGIALLTVAAGTVITTVLAKKKQQR